MNTNSIELNKYNFLNNQSIGEDLFKNKSQDKIAIVISEKIINQPNFKIIGIDGSWGSGKTNLIKLIEKKTIKTHKFFIYDVWGHQEDEHRKSILVELTDYIKSEKDLLKKANKQNWDDKLKILLAKSKETTTINQPYLSVGFIFSLLSIVYIPTVNVFKNSIRDFFEIDSLFWKLVLVAFPIFIVIGIYLWNTGKYLIMKKGVCKSFRLSAEETFQVYTNKQKEETKTETISEEQPSVRDFQNWMEEINTDLNKPIIIVFDNFDRLPKKHILSIWSSIHIFFAEKKYSNIKVIIPFDREHVQNAFEDLKFGDDYLNKTFDIVFRVTLPIMSNWKEFFEQQWKLAFDVFDDEEMKLTLQVYEFLNRRITPREIISFINEILTIKLIDNNFKERFVAIFVLKKDEILKDPLMAISNLEYLKGLKNIYMEDKEFPKQLTAIIYHIDVENALELIYTNELRDSLNQKDIDKFNKICKLEIAESIFSQVLNNLVVFENPIMTLSKLDKDCKIPAYLINQTWLNFYKKVLLNFQSGNGFQINDWQIELIKNNQDNDEYLNKLLHYLMNIINDNNIISYIELVDIMKDNIGEGRVLKNLHTKNIDSKSLIKAIEFKGDEFKRYKLNCEDQSIDKYISSIQISDILELKNTKTICNSFNLTDYIVHLKLNLKTHIEESNDLTISNKILIKLKETIKENTNSLNRLFGEMNYLNFYSNYSSSELQIIYELIAYRISNSPNNIMSDDTYFRDVLSHQNENKAKEISKTILNYSKYDELLLLSPNLKDSILYRDIILNLFSSSELIKECDVAKLIQNYKIIKDSLSIDDNKFMIELSKWEFDFKEIDFNELDDEFIVDCFKYIDLPISKYFIEAFNHEFKELNEDKFEIVFDTTSKLDIYFKYFDKLNDDSLTQLSLEVFKTCFLKQISVKSVSEEWWKVFNKYESNSSNIPFKNSLKDIRDKYLNNSIELDIHTAKKIIPIFFKHEIFKPESENFRTIIKNEFLNDSEYIDILVNNEKALKHLIMNTSITNKEAFINLIKEKREMDTKIEELASKILID